MECRVPRLISHPATGAGPAGTPRPPRRRNIFGSRFAARPAALEWVGLRLRHRSVGLTLRVRSSQEPYFTSAPVSGILGSAVTAVAAVCVCDGAGSAARGAGGAELASRVAVRYLARRFDLLHAADAAAVGADLIRQVRRPVRRAARGWRAKDFAATLVAVAADACGRSIVVHLGDGAVLGRRGNGPFGLVSMPSNGAYANVTYFITDGDAARRVRVHQVPNPAVSATAPSSFLLFTDGPPG